MGPVTVPLPADLPTIARVVARGHFAIALRDIEPLSDRAVHDILATCLRHVELKVFASLKRFFG
jgi:hypothetical protein